MCIRDRYNNTQPLLQSGSLTIISDAKTDVQCYIRKIEQCLYITFRGSNSKKDWQTNMMFSKKVIPYGNKSSKIRVHSGFLNAYKSPSVRNKIQSKLTNDILYVKISGHSQGAALALLCAVDSVSYTHL